MVVPRRSPPTLATHGIYICGAFSSATHTTTNYKRERRRNYKRPDWCHGTSALWFSGKSPPRAPPFQSIHTFVHLYWRLSIIDILQIARTWYKHRNNRLIAKVRGILVSQILRKNFLLRPHEAKRSAATTLMSTDVDGIVTALPAIHETWASVIELGLSIYFLSVLISQSGFLIILPAIRKDLLLSVAVPLLTSQHSFNGDISRSGEAACGLCEVLE